MSYKTVWKLCCEEDGKLVSAIAYTEGYKLEYEIGESTKPKVGLLFAFKTKRDAYVSRPGIEHNSIIVKCKARISQRKVPERVSWFEDRFSYWKVILKGKAFMGNGRYMPEGTIFCTEVIPIEIDNGVDLKGEKK